MPFASPIASPRSHPTSDFSGLWLPLVTPFGASGALDLDALKRLVAHYRDSGIRGLVVGGSTGEAAALGQDEARTALDLVLAEARGLPVIAGVPGNHLGAALSWVRSLQGLPLAGLLVAAPPYVRPSQAGLLQWFHQIADAAAAPVVLYDIPYRSGVEIGTDTLLALAAHPRIQAIKDCGGDAAKTQTLIADGRLQVLAGEEGGILGTLGQGGAGALLAAAHLRTRDFVALVGAARAGRWPEAHALWLALRPLVEAVYAEPNPAAIKWALAESGLIEADLRAPLTSLSEGGIARMRAVWTAEETGSEALSRR